MGELRRTLSSLRRYRRASSILGGFRRGREWSAAPGSSGGCHVSRGGEAGRRRRGETRVASSFFRSSLSQSSESRQGRFSWRVSVGRTMWSGRRSPSDGLGGSSRDKEERDTEGDSVMKIKRSGRSGRMPECPAVGEGQDARERVRWTAGSEPRPGARGSRRATTSQDPFVRESAVRGAGREVRRMRRDQRVEGWRCLESPRFSPSNMSSSTRDLEG